MKVTSIEINAKDMKDPKETAEKIMEALGIGGGTADPGDSDIDALIRKTGLNTLLKMEITLEHYGINVTAGGSKIACDFMCKEMEGFEELLEETKQKMRDIGNFFNEGMEELKRRKEEKENSDGNDL